MSAVIPCPTTAPLFEVPSMASLNLSECGSESSTTAWFFEGAEKLLELWFVRERDEQSLRNIPRAALDEIMRAAHCEIVSVTRSERIDAYVLSESSLFVSDERLIMKTCGTTRLLDALDLILAHARDYAHMDKVANVFYSRKNFAKPEEQPDKHKSFDVETACLDRHFGDGESYVLGSLKTDRWYLYTLPRPRTPAKALARGDGDQTLEILMQDLDPRVMDIFTEQVCANGAQATKLAGIDQLMPDGTVIDDKLFSPCGYSMNGVMPGTDHYCTMHITPEKEFSYVSFETNQQASCYYQQTLKVVKAFRPGRFILTVFADRAAHRGLNAQSAIWNCQLDGYKRSGLQYLLLPEHTLVYAHYKRTIGDDADSGCVDGDFASAIDSE